MTMQATTEAAALSGPRRNTRAPVFHEVPKLMETVRNALLIDACGRTDFQSGDAATLYRSIQEKLFVLPSETLVYPCHDYKHRQVSTIGQEKRRNPYIHQGTTEETFIATMNGLGLPYPRKIGLSVPGNEQCGRCPNNVPEEYAKPCLEQDADYGM
jgi:sulfur dioxygenase